VAATRNRPIPAAVALFAEIRGAILAFSEVLLGGCAPLYTRATHTTSTPRPPSFGVAELTHAPMATLGLLTPAGLQGVSPPLSHALTAALSEASPPISGMPSHETVNALNAQGLAAEYADLLSGFVRSGILERARLQRIGSALAARYVPLPGLAEYNQVLVDKFEAFGVKLVRNRVTTLRLWLQLWDTRTGQILWESAGETTVASEILRPERAVSLDEIAQKLWLRMIQDDLLGGSTRSRFFFSH
jgi:hypothetical protein